MDDERFVQDEAARDDAPELHGDFRDMAEQFIELLREADEQMARINATDAVADAEWDRERAEQARSGALGSDWSVVQGRIDLGQTSLQAVFSGEDTSPEAERLRGVATRNLEELRASWEEDKAEGEGEETPPTPDQLFAQTLRDSQARFEQAFARIQDVLDAGRRREEEDDV